MNVCILFSMLLCNLCTSTFYDDDILENIWFVGEHDMVQVPALIPTRSDPGHQL